MNARPSSNLITVIMKMNDSKWMKGGYEYWSYILKEMLLFIKHRRND